MKINMSVSRIKEIIVGEKLYEHSAKSILDELCGTAHFYDYYSGRQHLIVGACALKVREELARDENIVWDHQRFNKEVIYQAKPKDTNPNKIPIKVPSDFTKRESEIMFQHFSFLLNKGIKKIERIGDDVLLETEYVDGKRVFLDIDEWKH